MRKMKKFQSLLGMLALLVVTAVVLSSSPAEAEPLPQDWQFSVAFNLWAPAIKGETAEGEDVKITFSDILDNLDFTYMGTLAARKEKWTFLVDLIYMDLEDGSNVTLLENELLNLELTNIEMRAWIVTPMVAYNVMNTDRVDLDLLAGARYLWLKIKLKTELETLLGTTTSSDSESGDVWDGIVGARGAIHLNERWFLPFHFDIGTGETDLTYQAYGGVAYRMGQFDLAAGYRYLRWNFDKDEEGGKLFDNLYVTGPIITVRYRF